MTTHTDSRARHLPQTSPERARTCLTTEYAALQRAVDTLTPDEWARPTDCTGWTVRHMVAHLAGAAHCTAHRPTMLRTYAYAGRKAGKNPAAAVDYITHAQIEARAAMTDSQVAEDLRHWVGLAPGRLAGFPGFLRRLPLPAALDLVRGARVSYFLDVISSRDVWMHRVDLTRALGSTREVTAAEPEVVAQVIRDLDTEWGGPAVRLTLTGPGGGTWRLGGGDPVARVREDAVAYLRLLSGRSDECELEVTEGDPAAADSLRAARVVF
ncbi:MAG TPA: maleylpyruvate isomerase family mycothiol-dependent enzyme [Actinomycetales bacterium]|nr:maleylpyruvate isomerase family mycothiol-dependent enzyme [Actinomycetales bacterium]